MSFLRILLYKRGVNEGIINLDHLFCQQIESIFVIQGSRPIAQVLYFYYLITHIFSLLFGCSGHQMKLYFHCCIYRFYLYRIKLLLQTDPIFLLHNWINVWDIYIGIYSNQSVLCSILYTDGYGCYSVNISCLTHFKYF